jgi:hypothetical protein
MVLALSQLFIPYNALASVSLERILIRSTTSEGDQLLKQTPKQFVPFVFPVGGYPLDFNE